MICRRARTAELGCKSGGVPRGDLEGRGTQIGSIGVDFYWGRGPNAKELGVSVNPYLPLTDSAFQSHTVIIFRLVSVSQLLFAYAREPRDGNSIFYIRFVSFFTTQHFSSFHSGAEKLPS